MYFSFLHRVKYTNKVQVILKRNTWLKKKCDNSRMPKTSSSCNGYLDHYVLVALSLFYILNEGVGKVSFKENVFVFEVGVS